MTQLNRPASFRFKQFEVSDKVSAMKIGTDGVLLGAWAFERDFHPRQILDIGTGTGLISLMLAQRFPMASIHGIDISPDAIVEAAENVARSPWRERITLECNDVTHTPLRSCDAIVSNPPFFSTGQISPAAARAAARHESSLSISSLIAISTRALTPGGRLALIAPADRLDEITYLGAMARLDVCRVAEVCPTDHSAPIRVMAELIKGITPTFTRETIAIRTSGGFSPRYSLLTSEFYL